MERSEPLPQASSVAWSVRVLAGFAVAVAACSGGGSRATTTARVATTASTTTTTAPPATTTTRPRAVPPAKGSVTFAFAGDVHFEGPLRTALAADPAAVLASIAPVLRTYDLAMVNLETAITERGTPQPKQYTFRASVNALTALTAAGIDVATQANNHGVDFGPIGLTDTLSARAQSTGVKIIGIGRDAADAYAPYRATVHGERIAIIAASQVIDGSLIASWSATDTHPGIASALDVPRLLAAVRAARADSDTVIVFLHWGMEGTHCPTLRQRTTAAQLVGAGADIIVGSHSHQLEGAGHLGSALIDYGLGNFAFYTGTTTGILTVTMTGRHVDGFGWVPAHISRGAPQPVVGAAATTAVASWQGLRACTDLTP
jgi:poly-gamma-glutamate capsule biosynthesis protein CapA/YwtB (metallophosphatase superfamily)